MSFIISLLCVFLATLLATYLWLQLAGKLKWLDFPNKRSSHDKPVPKGGGAGYVLVFTLFATFLHYLQVITWPQMLLCLLALAIAIMGFLDDLYTLSIRSRLMIQFTAAVLALLLLETLPQIVFPWGSIQSPWFLLPFFVFSLVWIINLYNFMDGIDASAAMEAVFYCLALAFFANDGTHVSLVALALGLTAAICGFLYLNLPPARLFMGNLGSNYLGFLLAMLGLLAVVEERVNIWTLLILLAIYIVDATSTLIGRMYAGMVWYHGHRSHSYQIAATKCGSHGKVVLIMLFVNVFWLFPLAWWTTDHEDMGLFITLLSWLPLAIAGRALKVKQSSPG